MPDRTPVHLFYSYAHEDEVLRNELDKHLSVLRRQGLLARWHDRDIQAGAKWKQETDEHLNTASLILLLISPDFLASDYCYDVEMQRAMERHKLREARVIPVILRPCDWQHAPIGSLQVLPRDGRAITTWPNQDEAFLEVEQNLRALIEQPRKPQRSTLSSSVITKNREAMLLRLQRMYQELLTSSLQETAWIELGLAEQLGAVQNAANLILHQASQPERPLPPGTSVSQIYQEANHELLILGAPGAGKSTLLYQLGRDLLTTAMQQPAEPLPVLFPLSSWAQKRLPLGEWLTEQLRSSLYLVPRKQSQQWLQDEQILPLLDGLDEMNEAARPACIAAINVYRREHPLCPLVVCSRSAEYTSASSQGRLQLADAIEVQPLTSAQLDEALSQAGPPAAALRSELRQNEELSELSLTPLWLNVLLLTFKDTSVRALSQQRSALQKQMCERYIQRMIEEKGQSKLYPLEQTKHWLTFLAGQMRERNLTTFAVELLQPNWLKGRSRVFYRWSLGLIFGLIFGLTGGLFDGLLIRPIFGLIVGLLAVLVLELPALLNAKMWEKIALVERLIWSWKQARLWVVFGSLAGLIFFTVIGLLAGLLTGLANGLLIGLVIGLLGGLALGLFGGLFAGLIGGLTTTQYIEHDTPTPGEGLHRSLWSGLIGGLIVALVTGLIFGVFYSLRFVLIIGLFLGSTFGIIFGMGAVIQHFLLRIFLWQSGDFSFRAITFLEDACARHFLRRIGGNYQFVHRLLLDYFVDIDGATPPTANSAQSTTPVTMEN